MLTVYEISEELAKSIPEGMNLDFSKPEEVEVSLQKIVMMMYDILMMTEFQTDTIQKTFPTNLVLDEYLKERKEFKDWFSWGSPTPVENLISVIKEGFQRIGDCLNYQNELLERKLEMFPDAGSVKAAIESNEEYKKAKQDEKS